MKRLLTRSKVRTQVLHNQNLARVFGHGLKGTDVDMGQISLVVGHTLLGTELYYLVKLGARVQLDVSPFAVVRGATVSRWVGAANRNFHFPYPDHRFDFIGFRLVQD